MCLRNVCQTMHPITHYNVSPKRLPKSASHYTLQHISETSDKFCSLLHTTMCLRNVCKTLLPLSNAMRLRNVCQTLLPLLTTMCLRNVCQTLLPITHYNVSPKRLSNSAPHYTPQYKYKNIKVYQSDEIKCVGNFTLSTPHISIPLVSFKPKIMCIFWFNLY